MDMDLKLKGKTAVVTAASRGLGLAIAEKLAAEGANLVMCGRNREIMEQTAARIGSEYGVAAVGYQADVGKADDIARLVDLAGERFGRVDALLCNAGGPPGGKFLQMSDADWEQAFQTNLMSVIRLIRGFAPWLQKEGGRIAAIASTSVKIPLSNLVLSNTFRPGIAGLMKTLSVELAEYGILVNTIAPGKIRTGRIEELDAGRAALRGMSVEEVEAESKSTIPLGRYGRPEELAEIAAFLLSPANTYMTGSTFYVDGGLVQSL
jgi:3-oxoacyl-[acyl-carrier protein] reductase